jgi:hypothetical protein
MKKCKVKLNMSEEKPLPQVLLPLIPPLAQKLLQNKFSPYPYSNPFRTNLLSSELQTSDVKVTAPIQPLAKLNLKICVSLKQICNLSRIHGYYLCKIFIFCFG